MTDYLDRIKDDESAILSYIHLGGDTSKLNRFILRREESLGLIKKNKDGNYFVQEKAYPLLSDYPLFGRYKKTQDFESHLIPFVLASVNEGYIKAEEGKIKAYFNSDYFSSMFPGKDKHSDEALIVVESLRKLDIIKVANSSLCLDREKVIAFNKLDINSKISYIIAPELDIKERENHVKAIDLLLRLRCIDNLERYLNLIFNITKYDLSNDIEKLYALGIVYEDEDGLECVSFKEETHANAVVSSDFILSYSGVCKENLFFFLKPVKTDTITQWIVDKSTLRSSFSMGFSPSDVIALLESVSLYPLPETLLSRIEGWYEQFKTIELQRALVLSTDVKNARILDNLPLLKRHIISKPAETVFFLNPDTESEWRKILSYSGYDMLTDTLGNDFVSTKKATEIKAFDALNKLPIKRAMEFDSNKYESTLQNEASAINKLLYQFGLFEPSAIHMTEGLYFQEKMRVIQDSITKERLLFIEDIDSKIDVVTPKEIIHMEDYTLLETDKGSIVVDKLWLVAMLPDFAINPLSDMLN